MKTYDFIAVGDTVTDDFIELDDVRIDTKRDAEDRGYPEICFRFGDKVPFKESVVINGVGNAANAAVAAARLGLSTAFIADVGDDDLGKKSIEAFQESGVDCRWVRVHANMKSNHHYVLRYKAERTILVKHRPYPYALPEDLEPPKWLYFSSIGEHGIPYHHKIAAYIAAHPETKLVFQPGTFQIGLGYEAIKDVYEHSEVFFCNKDEARVILGVDETDIHELLKRVRALGPKIVVITDGPNGAYAYDGTDTWFVPMYPDPKPPLDRTGSGDAFSSTFTAGLASGLSISEALTWGPINSMSVVQYIGAREGLLSREKLDEYLKAAPDDYKVDKVA